MEQVVVLSGVRTPIGAFGGSLKDVPVEKMGAAVLNEALKRAGLDPGVVDDVIAGQSYQGGECANGARVALLEAGWPDSVPGVTLDRRCCSGLDAVIFGAMEIMSGNARVVAAAGMDSMSRAEMYIPGDLRWGLGGKVDPKWGFMPRGHGALSMWGIPFFDRIQRARVKSQPIERYGELNSMMSWAENAARAEGISREEADRWAFRSHQKALAAWKDGKFAEEVVPVAYPGRKGEALYLEKDETPREDASLEKLSRLKTVYPEGVCTAGNSSSENDGAGAVILAEESFALSRGLPVLARFVAGAWAACDPTLTYPAVEGAVKKVLAKAGLAINDIDIFEIQEAFAVQLLADARLMGIDEEDYDRKINLNGSGISLGHPIGATGVMRLVTLLHEMKRGGFKLGLETICGGGGQGVAAVFARD
ncbi:MAG TPA: thiolase family protein [Desulfobacteraceae bacterium]|nr:thiolase family protein [Desulfobacteraceae bacterium]